MELEKQPAHHKQDEVAYNRPDYREAKRERSVRVCFLYPLFSCWAACGHACMQSSQPSLCGGYILLFQVYTVNRESKYLLIRDIHALGVTQELLQLFSLCGEIEE